MSQREIVIKIATSMVGRNETDSSFRPIIDVYNAIRPLPRGYRMRYDDPWCAAFVSAVGAMAGLGDIILAECSCDEMIALYRGRGQYKSPGYDAQPGDLIFYNWDGNNTADHVGIIAEVIPGGYTVIEGNMSDAVGRRHVPKGWALTMGFAAPGYTDAKKEVAAPATSPSKNPKQESKRKAPTTTSTGLQPPSLTRGDKGLAVKAMQAILIVRGCSCGPDGADGDFGGNTETALRRFQREEGLEADGVCGNETWRNLLGMN